MVDRPDKERESAVVCLFRELRRGGRLRGDDETCTGFVRVGGSRGEGRFFFDILLAGLNVLVYSISAEMQEAAELAALLRSVRVY